jgi:hypothetical protein
MSRPGGHRSFTSSGWSASRSGPRRGVQAALGLPIHSGIGIFILESEYSSRMNILIQNIPGSVRLTDSGFCHKTDPPRWWIGFLWRVEMCAAGAHARNFAVGRRLASPRLIRTGWLPAHQRRRARLFGRGTSEFRCAILRQPAFTFRRSPPSLFPHDSIQIYQI